MNSDLNVAMPRMSAKCQEQTHLDRCRSTDGESLDLGSPTLGATQARRRHFNRSHVIAVQLHLFESFLDQKHHLEGAFA